MQAEPFAALAGFYRVLYFLAITIITFSLVGTAVRTFDDPPEQDGFSSSGFQDGGFEQSEKERRDHERDQGIALSAAGIVAMGISILALGSRFNPLRSGLLLGGLLLFFGGVGEFDLFPDGYGEPERSDVWTTFVISAIAFVVVAGSALWIDDGPGWSVRGRRTAD